jgi:uncharacterized protein
MGLSEIFINRAGRLRSGWRFAIYMVSLLLTVRLMFGVAGALLSMFGLSEERLRASYLAWGLQAFILLSAATLLGWGYGKLFEDLPPRALGWKLHRGWLGDWLKGSLVGAASLILAALVAVACGGFRFSFNSATAFSSIGKTLLLSALIFILAAAAEEAMFRGYPLQTMTRAGLAWLAILITSVIFSLGHLDNPNVVRGFTFINTALAGLWLALAYLRTRSLWFPLGIHWAWNWTMGAALGLPVSGIDHLTPNPLARAEAIGPAWLTGGAYGIEGGAACTLALVVSIIFVWRAKFLSATEEMKSLTDHETPKWERAPVAPRAQLIDDSKAAVVNSSDHQR